MASTVEQNSGSTSSATNSADANRAYPYQLLSRLLASPPDDELLRLLSTMGEEESDFGRALGEIAEKARNSELRAVIDEYNGLFIGLARGELIPFASYYLTGFLNEKPLAVLRGDLGKLGITREAGNKQPEDHIAALCEVMAAMITGRLGGAFPLTEQQKFFDTHLAPWASKFFKDLEEAEGASFYRPVGKLGRIFLTIETAAFELAA